ncbi:MAG: hypothetical protein SPG14_01390 [Lactobacillus amylovorus]|nr:hypothetical protein [Lactobacillus amylovorus]
MDKIKNGAVDPKTLKGEKIVPASEGIAYTNDTLKTAVRNLSNNTTIDVSGWNTSGVTDMSQVF